MKTFALLALTIPFLVVSLIPAAPPCTGRNCKVAPAQSDYTAYKPPSSFYAGRDTQHVHHRRINVDIVQVAQINPAYSSVYSPEGYDSVTQADILAQLKQLSLRNDQIAAMLFAAARSGVPAAPGTPVAPAVPAVPATAPAAVRPQTQGGGVIGLAVLNAKCAVCHQAGKLAPDQRFTLLDLKGNLVTLTDKQRFRVSQRTYAQSMPPPLNVHGIPPITDAEYAAIMDLLQ